MPEDFSALHILVADEDPSTRALTRDMVLSIGVTRVATVNGDRVLGEMRATPFDVLITEREMAPLDGIALTKRIRTAPDSPNPHIPILMVTASPTVEIVTAARDAGVTEFLIKPYSVNSLQGRLTAIVNQPRTFVKVSDYFGPDRRRARKDFYGEDQRRK